MKPSNAKITSTAKADDAETKQIIEQIATMSVLADAIPTCSEIPSFLQIDADFRSLSDSARDKYAPLFMAASEKLSQALSKRTNGKAIIAVLPTVSEPIKRTRRAAGDVTYF